MACDGRSDYVTRPSATRRPPEVGRQVGARRQIDINVVRAAPNRSGPPESSLISVGGAQVGRWSRPLERSTLLAAAPSAAAAKNGAAKLRPKSLSGRSQVADVRPAVI